jgi:predicted nucleotidyltransferase
MALKSLGLGSTLFGKTRLAVLSLLCLRPERRLYLRQIVRLVGLGAGTVQRELRMLTRCGILVREDEGRQAYFQANPDCPVLSELRSILVKTGGLADVLRERLAPLEARCRVAFIYGSFAAGTEDAESDVDVMVIGEASFAEVSDALGEVQLELGREINPTVYSAQDWSEKGALPFLQSVMSSPKIYLIGDEHDLAGLDQ